MTSAALPDRLLDVFQQVFNDDALQLSGDMTADDIPGWDSVMHVNLIFSLEDEFGIELDEAAQDQISTVGELWAAIAQALKD
jgi:acyl carrier protein